MTREEAKDVFLNRGFIEVEGCRGRIFDADKWREACIVVSKWLKEESVLDKIRAEIDKIYEREDNSVDCLSALDELKLFIDKYKAESEDKE